MNDPVNEARKALEMALGFLRQPLTDETLRDAIWLLSHGGQALCLLQLQRASQALGAAIERTELAQEVLAFKNAGGQWQ